MGGAHIHNNSSFLRVQANNLSRYSQMHSMPIL